TGEVIAGSVGSNKKLEFTVIGDTVNLASRLEALSKPYRAPIVASRLVVDALGATLGNECVARKLDVAVVHGRVEPTGILEICDATDPRAERVAVWERATEHYLARRWDEAVADFEEASRGLDDPAATYQIERCRELSAAPPSSSWTG